MLEFVCGWLCVFTLVSTETVKLNCGVLLHKYTCIDESYPISVRLPTSQDLKASITFYTCTPAAYHTGAKPVLIQVPP